jgi:hypothetical protein
MVDCKMFPDVRKIPKLQINNTFEQNKKEAIEI